MGSKKRATKGAPDVSFHVATPYPPQQGGGGGPPGGPQLRGLHHPHHGANPSLPPPHQQQPPPPSQSQHSGGPPGPAPTSTPPGPADMGKQGPPHLQGQPQMPQGGGMQLSYGVPNQQRPGQSQPYYTGPRAPTPRIANHRGPVVNMTTNNVAQPMFPSHVPIQQMSMYPSHVVPTPINPNPMFVSPGQMPMFSTQTRHQNTGTSYFPPPASQQQLMMHQQHQLYPGFQSGPQGHQFFFPSVRAGTGMGGASGVGGPGLAGNTNQQVVVPGAPPQLSQGPQVSMMPMSGSNVIVPGMTGDSGGPAGPVGSGGSSGKLARRKYALDIIDPKTMKNVEIYEQGGGNTPPRSGDSSARETPQPTTGPGAMDVAADFAARVAKVASENSSGPPPTQPLYSEPPNPIVPPQVGNVNGPDHIMNSIVTSSEGVLSQSDASISKPQIVVLEETTASTTSWKPQTQPKASNVGLKSSSANKSNKIEISMNKVEDHGHVKLESDSTVKQQSDRERSIPPGVPSVSAKDIPIQVSDIPVAIQCQQIPVIGKEHQPIAHTVEIPPPDVTPVVSALTNSPAVELIHHRSPRDQFPGLKSSGGSGGSGSHSSPRRKRDPAPALVEKSTVPQSVSLVPSISVVSSQTPAAPAAEMKPREHSVPPVSSQPVSEPKQPPLQQKKLSPAPETPVDEASMFVTPAPKERREQDKSSRGREKSSQNREMERPSVGREKSQGHDREKSSQGRSKGSPVPMASPISGASPVASQPELPVQVPRPPVKPVPLSPPQPVEEIKHQANGETPEASDGKATQRPKHSKRGPQKMRDLTRKGTEKEGQDMDAFSEPPTEEVASVPALSSPAPSPAPIPTNKIVDNEVTNDESETDKEEDKLVAARNEENNKVSAAAFKEDTPVIETPPAKIPAAIILKHNYKEDQWSPVNTDGKKKYEREFLIKLKNEPQSKKKPENLPDLEVVLKDNRQSRAMDMSRGAHDTFAPKFMSSGSSRGGPPPKRNSQQGKAKGNKPNVIHVSLSFKEEVKLRESENAWKPGKAKANVISEEEAKTEDLYKKVRGVLNKLTPQKFGTLVQQVQSLAIDNSDRLQGVINLVFDKAIDEPSFSVGYAQMCKILSNMQVPAERKSKDDPEYVNFRKLIVNRCQQEFEKNNEAELNRDARFKELQNIVDTEKKKELQVQYQDEERRMRMKSVGNIRFIGELFKLQMLTTNIMHRCIRQLLQDGDEESLECLCKLLTTIGKDLETKSQDLSAYFKKMKEIASKRGEVSSRVRFMLQDVIDLRQGKWVPRRDDSNPKTIDQIQREAEKESLDQQMALNAAPPPPRRQDDRGSGGDRRKNRNVGEDGWSLAGSRSKGNYSVDTTRLKQKVPEMDTLSLGSRSIFTNWASNKPADVGKKSTAAATGTSNFFSALQDMSSDEKKSPLLTSSPRSGSQKSTPSAVLEKERMISFMKTHNEDSRISRGNSIQQPSRSSSRDNATRGAGEELPRSLSSLPVSSAASTEDIRKSPESSLAPEVTLSDDQIKKETRVLLDEYFCNSNEVETAQSVAETFGVNNISPFVVECLNIVLEMSTHARGNVGRLMSHLIKENVVTKSQYLAAFSEIISEADDLAIDIPKIWLYLAEIIVPLLSSETLNFADIREVARQGNKLLAEVLHLLVKDRGPAWIREKWEAESIIWSDFMEAEYVGSFIQQHKLEFTLEVVSGNHMPLSSLTMDEIQQKLLQFLKPEPGSNHSFDQICEWIGANVGNGVSEPQFIRALMTALCESAVSQSPTSVKLRDDVLVMRSKFFNKYIDNKEENELQCLYAVQTFVHRLEHPQGLLCNLFQVLWDNSFISTDSFTTWEKSSDPCEQVGKGVALKSLTTFFTALREGEDESEES